MIEPRMKLASMSDSQWARRYSLEKLTARMMSAVVSAAVIFVWAGLFRVSIYVIIPKNTIVIVTWPLGNEKLVVGIIVIGGRATWRMAFVALTIMAVIRTIDARIMVCFFLCLRKR